MTTSKKEACAQVPRAERIARLNNDLRQGGKGGAIVVTCGVMSLDGYCGEKLAMALAAYDGFDPDNDPHGERDFGDLELFGASLLWKIDYYDRDLRFGSNDPADAAMTARVLTVMLEEEF
jgi:hypothetical protein